MFKISEIISKPVYTLYEGINVGTVKNFLFDLKQKKIKGFYIFDDETETHDHFISSSRIHSIGESSLIIKNLETLSASITNTFIEDEIINQKAITLSGDCLGKIKDLFFDENFLVLAFETNNGIIIPATKLSKVGKDAVLFDNSDLKTNISKFKPKNKISVANLPEIKVSILDLEEDEIKNVPIISNNFDQNSFSSENKIEGKLDIKEKPKRQEIIFPKKLLADPKSIIGKISNKTIYGLNGEVVVKDRQVISEKIYQKARKHAKLFELTNSIE